MGNAEDFTKQFMDDMFGGGGGGSKGPMQQQPPPAAQPSQPARPMASMGQQPQQQPQSILKQSSSMTQQSSSSSYSSSTSSSSFNSAMTALPKANGMPEPAIRAPAPGTNFRAFRYGIWYILHLQFFMKSPKRDARPVSKLEKS